MTVMSEQTMVERVRDAIDLRHMRLDGFTNAAGTSWRATHAVLGFTLGGKHTEDKANFIDRFQATSAIAAMREPTAEMVCAAYSTMLPIIEDACEPNPSDYGRSYRDMIDAALSIHSASRG